MTLEQTLRDRHSLLMENIKTATGDIMTATQAKNWDMLYRAQAQLIRAVNLITDVERQLESTERIRGRR